MLYRHGHQSSTVICIYISSSSSYYVVEAVTVWPGHGTVLPGAAYRPLMCWTEHETYFGRLKASLFLQNVYNAMLVVDYKYCERSVLFLRGAHLIPAFIHTFIFLVLHHFLSFTCKPEDTLDEVDFKRAKWRNCDKALTVTHFNSKWSNYLFKFDSRKLKRGIEGFGRSIGGVSYSL